jgi:hypothetical protein
MPGAALSESGRFPKGPDRCVVNEGLRSLHEELLREG